MMGLRTPVYSCASSQLLFESMCTVSIYGLFSGQAKLLELVFPPPPLPWVHNITPDIKQQVEEQCAGILILLI